MRNPLRVARAADDRRSAVPPPAPPLVADRPIERASDDRLGRLGLVDAIVRTVERAPHDGFVVGLAGPWGEGKTSVLKLVAERLDTRGSAQVIWFNPWMFAGSSELVERFFSEFAAEVGVSGGAATNRLADAAAKYGEAVSRLGSVPYAGRPARTAAAAARGAERLLRAGVTLHDRRKELKNELERLDRPVAVMIDDLDRLRAQDEIAEMARLIRLVGDLPRVTYVVTYEPTQVTRALGGDDSRRGQDYLERIVQATFDLPPPRRDLLDKLLTEAINQSLEGVEHRLSQERMSTLQLRGLWGMFRNLRDVRRYASVLPATVGLIGDEVELADVLTLEAIRVLEPEVFRLLPRRIDALTNAAPSLWRPQADRDESQRRELEEIVAEARRPAVVRDLLRELFPVGGRHLGGSNYSESFQGVWRRERRVAVRDVFMTYLERALPAESLSARTVEDALNALADRDEFEAVLSRTPEAKLPQLLGRLEDYEGSFDLPRPAESVEGLVTVAARLTPPSGEGLRYGPDIAVSRLLVRILRTREPQEVESIVSSVSFPTLSARFEVARLIGHREGAGSRLVSEDAAERFEKELAEEVLSGNLEQLRQEPALSRLLWAAHEYAPDRAREKVGELIKDDLFLTRWLAETMYEKRGSYGRAFLVPWPRLVEYVDADQLASRVATLEEERASEVGGDLAVEAVKQAKRYARDSTDAERDLEAFTGGLSD